MHHAPGRVDHRRADRRRRSRLPADPPLARRTSASSSGRRPKSRRDRGRRPVARRRVRPEGSSGAGASARPARPPRSTDRRADAMTDQPSIGDRLAALGSRCGSRTDPVRATPRLDDARLSSGPARQGRDRRPDRRRADRAAEHRLRPGRRACHPRPGLYASLVPLLAYAVFGSSRRLIIGPDAATAALVGAAIAPLAVAADDRIRMASALALLVAVVFIAMRLAALGFLSEFLSRPLLVGYMTGIGINVAMGQVPKILGGSPIEEFLTVLGGIDFRSVEPGAILGALGIALSHTTANLRRPCSAGWSWRRSSPASAGCPASRSRCRRCSSPWQRRPCWTCPATASGSSARSRPGCRRSRSHSSASTRRSRCCRPRSASPS